jgi:hypothetical protein
MNKKIIGIFICMLLILATTLSVSGSSNEKTKAGADQIDLVPILDFKEIKGGLLGLSVLLENSGMGPAYNVYWEMRASGGLFFYANMKNGEFPTILPGEQVKIKISPAIGLGIVTIEFYCRYLIEGMYCETEIEVKQEWRNRALLILNTFPEEIQPQKEWMEVEEYFYYESDDPELMLQYQQILNMHNVRGVSSADSENETVEFRAACKFTDGIGYLKECWVTRDLVESGIGHWEVELVDGE